MFGINNVDLINEEVLSSLDGQIKISVHTVCRDSSVGIATGYGLDGRGVRVRVPVGARLFSSPRRADRFWGLPSLLSNGYRGSFPGGKAAGA
jgi:hypothetical protein